MMATSQTEVGVESLMPKGVEHLSTSRSHKYFITCVESLMPKGVEHKFPFTLKVPFPDVSNL